MEDLANLPAIHFMLDGLRTQQYQIKVGERNNTLYRFALETSHLCR
jgi:hypothetical protein